MAKRRRTDITPEHGVVVWAVYIPDLLLTYPMQISWCRFGFRYGRSIGSEWVMP